MVEKIKMFIRFVRFLTFVTSKIVEGYYFKPLHLNISSFEKDVINLMNVTNIISQCETNVCTMI